MVQQLVQVLRSVDCLISDVQGVWASALNLSVPQWNILVTIADAEDKRGMPVKSVAEALRVNSSFIVHQSRPLEALGLVQRTSSSTDKRIVYLSITPKARRELGELAQSRSAVSASIKQEVGEAAMAHTVELLKDVERCLLRCRLRLEIED
ncbi:MarR family transcriptional regulator [Bradyrhizobium sp. 15]|uniref:MarR family winged helix-turn-helix transcriptional regulator n=1 Tax=Bradyrhizobium sp. 15 TaxID=2782633 RepID=UPI001FFBAFC6|nr:MarR family transcriptional regulator [Bradyrhizobium sp. 15]